MKLLLYFARAYPLESALMIAALLLAAIADGIGMSSVIGLFSMAEELTRAPAELAQTNGWLEKRVVAFYAALGFELSVPTLLGTIVVAIWLKSVLSLLAKRQVGYTVARAATDLRLRLLDALMTTRWSYFIHQPIGAVGNAFATEAERAAGAYLYATMIVSILIQATLYTGIALVISWQATLGNFVLASLGLLVLRFLVRATRKAGQKQTRLMKTLLSRLSDTLQSLKPLKAMAREDRIQPLLAGTMLKLNRVAQKRVLASEALGAIQEPLVVSFLAIGAWVCLLQLGMDWKLVTGLGLVLARVLLGLAKAQRQYTHFVNNESAFWSLLEMIEKAEGEKEENPGGERPQLAREVELRGVHFGYDDHAVLEDANLTIPAGQITALIGPSGAGKTTISDLIIGLIEPNRGEVLIDGLPLRKVDLRAWRERIGYVPQEMFLLNDTILENVTLGESSLTRDQVEDALRRAGAWEFVEALTEGMDTLVGERGARLSGGQRQRVAIARALVHQPCLLVLDEATTALDPATEEVVWDALLRLRGEVTILAVSHQPRLNRVADRIYRIEAGQASLQKGPEAPIAVGVEG